MKGSERHVVQEMKASEGIITLDAHFKWIEGVLLQRSYNPVIYMQKFCAGWLLFVHS